MPNNPEMYVKLDGVGAHGKVVECNVFFIASKPSAKL